MTPQSDHSMFDFDELDNLKERETQQSVHKREYRGEDAVERFRLAETRIVQEAVMNIEGNEGDDDDDNGSCPGGQFSDTEDEKCANARFVPGARAEKVRVRIRVRRKQQPNRAPSLSWLEPEEETTPVRKKRPGWSSPLLMRQGSPKRRRRHQCCYHPCHPDQNPVLMTKLKKTQPQKSRQNLYILICANPRLFGPRSFRARARTDQL